MKVMHNGIETNVYINFDRIFFQLESFRISRNEVKLRQAIADQNSLSVKYIIRNNKIVKLSKQPFCFNFPGDLGLVAKTVSQQFQILLNI